MRIPMIALVALFPLALAQPVTAQTAPTLDLGKRLARSKYTFGTLFSVQELSDGRVVASDSKENAFRLVDLAKGDMALMGTQGEDPDNYRSARGVYRIAGDSLLLFDLVGRQFIHVSPKGEIAGFTKLPAPKGGNSMIANPLAVDPGGAIYTLGLPEMDTATKSFKSTVTIRRIPADGDQTPQDVGRINLRGTTQVTVPGINPFPYRDAWALRSDGVAARVMADTYQVIWSKDGKETGRTGPLPYQPIVLTPAEQQAFHDSVLATFQSRVQSSNAASGAPGGSVDSTRRVTMGGMGAMGGASAMGGMGGGAQTITFTRGDGGGGGGGAPITMQCSAAGCTSAGGAAAPPAMTFDPSKLVFGTFPANKPPMLASANAAIFDTEGHLWITRERVHGDPIPHMDVVAEGRGVIAHVNLPEKTRVVGFGKGVVYLAHTDGDEEYLERYPLPKVQ